MLSGVQAADLIVAGATPGFAIYWPRSATSGSNLATLGAPASVDGRAPVIPPNGLVNLTFNVPEIAATQSIGEPLTLRVYSRQWIAGWVTTRTATCLLPTSCIFTFVNGTVLPSVSPSPLFPTTISPSPSASSSPQTQGNTVPITSQPVFIVSISVISILVALSVALASVLYCKFQRRDVVKSGLQLGSISNVKATAAAHSTRNEFKV
jgi:hypothetical protein